MKRFMGRKAYLLSMLVLSACLYSLPAFASSHHDSDGEALNPVTGATAAGPKAVNLGTAGDFVILTKTGITTTGTTAIVGSIGVSPIVATSMTGFGLIADSTNTFSTSSLVTGKIY